MKKLILILSVVFFTACVSIQEDLRADPSVSSSGNGFEVDHIFIAARVVSLDENSVTFSTNLRNFKSEEGLNTYPFSKEAIIKIFQDGKLAELSPKAFIDPITFFHYFNDYYFYFVLSGNEVLEMTQAPQLAYDFDPDLDDLVYVTDVYQRDGKDFISVDPMEFTSCAELLRPDCPNGYALGNEEVESIEYEVPRDRTIIFVIDWKTSIAPAYPMSFDDFQEKFSNEKTNFVRIPYHLGIEQGKVDSLVEKYLY